MCSIFASTFNVTEWLAVTGLAQSVLIIVYIVFRVRSWRQAALALAYFLMLGLAFTLQFSLRLEGYEEPIRLMLWLCRTLGPPLCYLLVLQVAKGADLPQPRQFWFLALAPLALVAGFAIRYMTHICTDERRTAVSRLVPVAAIAGVDFRRHRHAGAVRA